MKKFLRYILLCINDKTVRNNLFSFIAFLFNVCYVALNVVFGIAFANVLFVTVAAYYTMLALMRYLLLERQASSGGSAAAAVITVAAPAVSGIILYTAVSGNFAVCSKALIPVFSLYALYSAVRVCVSFSAFRRARSREGRAECVLRLSIALMSLFNFQSSLFSAVNINEELEVFFNFLTGVPTSASVFAISLFCRYISKENDV